MKCEQCHVYTAKPQNCPVDGRTHHHGAIHLVGGGGVSHVCDGCRYREARLWHKLRQSQANHERVQEAIKEQSS